jgi:hypothetical protein
MYNKYLLITALLLGFLQLSACSNNEVSKTKTTKQTAELTTETTKQPAKLDVKLSVQQALKNNDYRLFHSKGRRIIVPGLEQIELSMLKSQCGIKPLKNSGDVIRNKEQKQQQNAQYAYAKQRIEALGLTEQITLLKKDYRDLTGEYDKLVSIEMIEAVGFEYLPSFFQQCNQRLKSGGKLLIQSITIADQRFGYYKQNVDFIQRYIFPGGFLPSVTILTQNLTQHTELVTESIDDIGLDYAKTLAHWREAFLNSWSELTQFGYDEKFKRLWLYYFAYCEGAFLERSTSTVHLLARK